MGLRIQLIVAAGLAGLAALAAGCADEQAVPAPPVDQGTQELIVFPDTGRGDGAAPTDAPADAPPWQEQGWTDAPALDAPPWDLTPPDQPQPDLTPPPDLAPPPDLTPPDQPVPPCGVWSHYSCTSGSFPYTCVATCTVNPALRIQCISLFTKQCNCVKNGNNVGTTSTSTTGCAACQGVLGFCASKF